MGTTGESNGGNRKPKKNFYKVPNGFSGLSEKDQDAWISQVYDDFASRVDENYEVTVRGAGLFGVAIGKKTFEDTLTYLEEIHTKRALKCRPNWCRPCSLYKLDLSQGLVYHVLQISKTNAKRIVSTGSFSWAWSNPDGEFAKSKDSPDLYWKQLAESKSKPVFYTRIMSEDYAEYLLGSDKNP